MIRMCAIKFHACSRTLQQLTSQLLAKNSRGNILVDKKRKRCSDGSRPHWIMGVVLQDIPDDPMRVICSEFLDIPFNEAAAKYMQSGQENPINVSVSAFFYLIEISCIGPIK